MEAALAADWITAIFAIFGRASGQKIVKISDSAPWPSESEPQKSKQDYEQYLLQHSFWENCNFNKNVCMKYLELRQEMLKVYGKTTLARIPPPC